LREYFLISVLLGIFVPAGLAENRASCAPVRQEFNESYSISTSGHVRLKADTGAVYIRGDDRTTVLVQATKIACTQASLDGTEIHVDAHPQNSERPEHLDIETRYSRREKGDAVRVEYRITVPSNVSLDHIFLRDGDISVSEVNGRIHAKTARGTVDVEGIRAPSELASAHGAVRAVFARVVGAGRLSSVRGDIYVILPSDSNTDVEATTGLHEITNEFGVPASETNRGHSLTFRIGRGTAHLDMIAFAGAITIVRADDEKPLSAVVNLAREQPGRALIW
jgi:hypothetical protein